MIDLRKFARETAAKLVPHTTSVHNCTVIEEAFKEILDNRLKQKLTNTEVLLFILGYQGGTVFQLAEELDVDVREILQADYDKMQDLMRKAQRARYEREKASKP